MTETIEIPEAAWWRQPKALRALLAGLPVVVIATLAITFWVLSLVRGDEYKVLPVGSVAPDFSLPTVAGDRVSLGQHLGKHPFILYFNEGMG